MCADGSCRICQLLNLVEAIVSTLKNLKGEAEQEGNHILTLAKIINDLQDKLSKEKVRENREGIMNIKV
ncbi:MAG: hypothetical protein Fur0024_3030 [Patescibacteria group bacterium]